MAGYIGTKASVVSSGAERKKVFDITTTTTSLTGCSYTPNQVHVFHNGVRLVDGTDYTATNGTSLTLTTAAQNGDEVVVISYATFQTSDTVSASAGGTFSNAVTVNGNLTVDTNTLFVDAANNRVGIGTSSPASRLTVSDGSSGLTPFSGTDVFMNSSGDNYLQFGSGSSSSPAIYFGDSADGDVGGIIYSHATDAMSFRANAAERMRIDASGNLLVAATSVPNSSVAGCRFSNPNAAAPTISRGSGTTEISMLTFQNGNGTIGQITTNGSATSYVTSSDYRLKENVVPLAGAADRIAQIPVHRFNFIADPDTTVDGFLAHEVQAFVPECVTGQKDEVDDEGNPKYQGIDQSKLVPLLTAALQEALSEIQDLKARVATLEGGAA